MKIFATLYTDEDIANLVATLLRARGIDVLTTLDAGMTGHSDAEQLAYSTSENRCLLTHNRVDFENLHLTYVQTNRQHCEIVITPQKNVYEVSKRVGILLDALTADEIDNQLLYA